MTAVVTSHDTRRPCTSHKITTNTLRDDSSPLDSITIQRRKKGIFQGGTRSAAISVRLLSSCISISSISVLNFLLVLVSQLCLVSTLYPRHAKYPNHASPHTHVLHTWKTVPLTRAISYCTLLSILGGPFCCFCVLFETTNWLVRFCYL